MALLNLSSICRAYSTERYSVLALHDVNLQIDHGEFVAIMGPSGCGKTTLLSIMGMLDSVSTGSIHVEKEDVSKISDNQRSFLRSRTIGFIFQSFNLIDELTALENVELPFMYSSDLCDNSREKAKDALGRVGLEERIDHMPAQLSGGEMQRVAIARAIVMEPRIIFADEPTGNLDSLSGELVMNLIANLHDNGTTVVLVTHDEIVASKAERIVRMENGRVVSS